MLEVINFSKGGVGMFQKIKQGLLRFVHGAMAAVLLTVAFPLSALANSTVSLNPAQTSITASSFGAYDCSPDFGGGPYPDKDVWIFVLPSPSESGQFVSVDLSFDTNGDSVADVTKNIPTEGALVNLVGPASRAYITTPAGWVLMGGSAEITGEYQYFNLTHTCPATGPVVPTLDVLTYDYATNSLSGSGTCTNPIIYGEMYDSNGNQYMNGNLNTNTNSVCVDGHYSFYFSFSYWGISPNFDLNNPNELRVYSLNTSYPQQEDVYVNGYFTRTQPFQTPVGSNVSVDLGDGVTVTFDNVTAGGTTTVSASSHPNVAPKAIKYGTPGHYLSFSTDATVSGNVKVCVNYDPATISGNEANLKMSQFDSGWTDITESLDTENNILCGVVTGI